MNRKRGLAVFNDTSQVNTYRIVGTPTREQPRERQKRQPFLYGRDWDGREACEHKVLTKTCILIPVFGNVSPSSRSEFFPKSSEEKRLITSSSDERIY